LRPRRVARRRIPDAAFCDSEYFSDAFGSRISVSDGAHEHSSPSLWHPEVLRVKSSPCRQIPALGQRVEDDPEVCAFRASRAVEPFDVLNEDGSGTKSVNDSHELEEESAAFSCEPGALSGNAEVLAGESSTEEIKTLGGDGIPIPLPTLNGGDIGPASTDLVPPVVLKAIAVCRDAPDIVVDVDSWESGGEDGPAVLIDLCEEPVIEPGPLEADVHPADAREERSNCEPLIAKHLSTPKR
jgi:hypothetical protein